MGTTQNWYAFGAGGGGPIAALILLVGAAGLFVVGERFYFIVARSKNSGRAFIEQIIQQVRAGKVDEAIKVCAQSKAALSDMGLIMLRSRSRDEAELRQIASAATLAVLPRLTHRLHYLRTFAMVAIMLGLLSTLRTSSLVLLDAHALAGPQLLVQLGDALQPTILGLTVAIILSIGRGYLANQAESIIQQIHEFSARLINALIDLPDVRLGHR